MDGLYILLGIALTILGKSSLKIVFALLLLIHLAITFKLAVMSAMIVAIASQFFINHVVLNTKRGLISALLIGICLKHLLQTFFSVFETVMAGSSWGKDVLFPYHLMVHNWWLTSPISLVILTAFSYYNKDQALEFASALFGLYFSSKGLYCQMENNVTINLDYITSSDNIGVIFSNLLNWNSNQTYFLFMRSINLDSKQCIYDSINNFPYQWKACILFGASTLILTHVCKCLQFVVSNNNTHHQSTDKENDQCDVIDVSDNHNDTIKLSQSYDVLANKPNTATASINCGNDNGHDSSSCCEGQYDDEVHSDNDDTMFYSNSFSSDQQSVDAKKNARGWNDTNNNDNNETGGGCTKYSFGSIFKPPNGFNLSKQHEGNETTYSERLFRYSYKQDGRTTLLNEYEPRIKVPGVQKLNDVIFSLRSMKI